MLKYETYWSIHDLPSNSIRSYDVLLYVGIAAIVAWFLVKFLMKSRGNYEKQILLWVGGFVSVFCTVMFIFLYYFTTDDTDKRLNALLTSDKVGVISGPIVDFTRSFHPHKLGVRTDERFRVDSIQFAYSDALLGGFNMYSQTNNGVFKDGLPVRITYGKIHHEILKVELIKD